ncbi:UvrD/REP helicase N-terminal domain-containing protein [Eubacterium uniforme]|uniref:UvrD/REP helicase N-terminal domain-containing protein n=1 Tax=Eubacterium uniforme TaxID=39495 RepID=A0A1T4VKB4_9FIRM|nr:UvrD-helicase domain-containing protein [Eubacterium uniforme]SKA65414.1 UvrD/REP helicase N-terminal domain-containing protein [Eubacterium uniforme]
MAKQVILAVAGAGKTYHICHEIQPDKRNLIVAFTHANIKNIQNELIKAYGKIPDLTRVMTFDTFVYHMLIRPYEAAIFDFFGEDYSYDETSITIKKPPEQRIKVDSHYVINKKYRKKDCIWHYMDEKKQYYCETLSELAMYIKQGRNSLVRTAAMRLNRFFDNVMIDEFQDFREYDYELIVKLSKYLTNIFLVGDYYQHSVSGQNNSGKPFKMGKTYICYDDFIEKLQGERFDVDETSLIYSRRCSEEICSFVRKKLGIRIYSAEVNSGAIIRPLDVKKIIDDKNIKKLVFDNSSKYSFNAINWSYSKGDTYESACVILNGSTEELMDDNFSSSKLKTVTLNKLYVALTRSKGDLYIITKKEFDVLKEIYMK